MNTREETEDILSSEESPLKNVWLTSKTMDAIVDSWDTLNENPSNFEDALKCLDIPEAFRGVAEELGIQQSSCGKGEFERSCRDEVFSKLASSAYAVPPEYHDYWEDVTPATIKEILDISAKQNPQGEPQDPDVLACQSFKEYLRIKSLITHLPFKVRGVLAKAGLYPQWFIRDTSPHIVGMTLRARGFDNVYLRYAQPDTCGCRKLIAAECHRTALQLLNDSDPDVIKAAISFGVRADLVLDNETIDHLSKFNEPSIRSFYEQVQVFKDERECSSPSTKEPEF